MDLTRYPDLKVNLVDTFATASQQALGIEPTVAVEGKPVTQISEQSPAPSLVPQATETTPAARQRSKGDRQDNAKVGRDREKRDDRR